MNMRELTKSIFSYAWSSSLFGFQQAVTFFTPQGWGQTDHAAESFQNITKVTAEQMGQAVSSTFKAGDEIQRKSMDVMFDLFTPGVVGSGQRQSNSTQAPSSSSANRSASSMGEQTIAAFTQGLQAASQTVGVIVQSLSGVLSAPGCGGSRAQPTGWGPVPPPPQSKSQDRSRN
jgi:hypothetical protein